MPEVKNTFIASKMNQDLDARLIPNREYREALNIAVSKSEEDEVGSLENILGNSFLTRFGLDEDCGIEIIGHCVDDLNDNIYVFLTNYSDSSANRLDNKVGELRGVFCGIAVYNTNDNSGQVIVSGNFLNFSKTNYITGVNIIENLLFWTDNRNQPRKINVLTAISDPWIRDSNGVVNSPGYYNNEDTVSVAKYYPYSPIDLVKGGIGTGESTMKDKDSEFLPAHVAALVDGGSPSIAAFSNTLVLVGKYENIQIGDLVTGKGLDSTNPNPTVSNVVYSAPNTTITIGGGNTIKTPTYTGAATYEPIVYFQSVNPDFDNTWPGDPNYLEDKFVRFSYRFKFDDDEYSLIAPFTQECFIPKQDGYFIGYDAEQENPSVGQEMETVRSTIVNFMRNKVNDIQLLIKTPTNQEGDISFTDLFEELKVKEIDILYKSSDDLNIKIVDTLKREYFENPDNILNDVYGDKLIYNYQSTKPWKVLPEKEITRVYDKVPIRALAQESSGNRIIYGNFVDKHTSPSNLDYSVEISEKPELPSPGDLITDSSFVRQEYQNHTLKQNRNYQVGVVLSDRYGRQSDVILSNIITDSLPGLKGSTIFHPYKTENFSLIEDVTDGDPTTWPGDMINAIFYNQIPSQISANGYPGLYSIANGTLIGYENLVDDGGWPPLSSCTGTLEGDGAPGTVWATVSFSTNGAGFIDGDIDILTPGDEGVYYQGQLLTINSACPGEASVTAITPEENPLGWYTYKIVVKQIEQDYYNCYLPGSLAGYPIDGANEPFIYPIGEQDKTGHTVLLNDNINKIPRELKEVGPDQKQFGSGITLYGRVENFVNSGRVFNRQYSSEDFHSAVTISTLVDLNLGGEDINATPIEYLLPPFSSNEEKLFYQGNTNPLIARIETSSKFGVTESELMQPFLSVYETKPLESNLDIFWETSTAGLISELNELIVEQDSLLPVEIENPNISWSENAPAGEYISAIFTTLGPSGTPLSASTSITLDSVVRQDSSQAIVTPKFLLEETAPSSGQYRIRTSLNQYDHEFWFKDDSCAGCSGINQYKFILTSTRPAAVGQPAVSITQSFIGNLSNDTPKHHLMNPTPGCIKELTWYNNITMSPGNKFDNYGSTYGPVIGTGSSTPYENNPIVGINNQDWALPFSGLGSVAYDGTFKVVNGAWDSSNTPPANQTGGVFGGVQKGQQMSWTIARAYQVSCYRNTGPGAEEIVFGYANAPNTGWYTSSGSTSLPGGPIYWSNDTTTTIDVEQQVGELYNNGKHYWPDIQYWIDEGYAPNANTILPLSDPGGTGYGGTYLTWNVGPLQSNVVSRINNQSKAGFWNLISSGASLAQNKNDAARFIVGCSTRSDYWSNSGVSPSLLTSQCPSPISNKGAEASIMVAAGNINDDQFQLPAGRYVVTLRATDANGTGTGSDYVEWDIPIWIPPYQWGECLRYNADNGNYEVGNGGCWPSLQAPWPTTQGAYTKYAPLPTQAWIVSGGTYPGYNSPSPWQSNPNALGTYADYVATKGLLGGQFPPEIETYPGGGPLC